MERKKTIIITRVLGGVNCARMYSVRQFVVTDVFLQTFSPVEGESVFYTFRRVKIYARSTTTMTS